MSFGEALRTNFIDPLKSKAGYNEIRNSITQQKTGFNPSTLTPAPLTTDQSGNNAVDTASVVNFSKTKSGENVQCGRLVNDYWTQVTGKSL